METNIESLKSQPSFKAALYDFMSYKIYFTLLIFLSLNPKKTKHLRMLTKSTNLNKESMTIGKSVKSHKFSKVQITST